MPLTYNRDPEKGTVEPQWQISRSKVISFESYHVWYILLNIYLLTYLLTYKLLTASNGHKMIDNYNSMKLLSHNVHYMAHS